MTCAPSEDSDQPGHPPSLIRETLGPWLFIECTAETLIRLGGCLGWSASSPCARIILFVLSSSGSVALLPCRPKSKSSFSTFPVLPNCLCAPVPLIFRPQFLCSPEINAFVPVFPKTPAWTHHTSMTSWVKQIQLSTRSCTGSQCDMIT